MGSVRNWLLGCWETLARPAAPPLASISPPPATRAPNPPESCPPGSPGADPEPPSFHSSAPCSPASNPPVDPLDNRPWIKLVEDCVDLFDELHNQLPYLDPSGRELAEHVCLRLQEILQRGGVDLIDQEGAFERTLHQPDGVSGADLVETRVRIISPGLRVGRRVLRRARVQPLAMTPADTLDTTTPDTTTGATR